MTQKSTHNTGAASNASRVRKWEIKGSALNESAKKRTKEVLYLLFPRRKGKVVGKTRVVLAFAAATSAALAGSHQEEGS